jgi:hypothetical protein
MGLKLPKALTGKAGKAGGVISAVGGNPLGWLALTGKETDPDAPPAEQAVFNAEKNIWEYPSNPGVEVLTPINLPSGVEDPYYLKSQNPLYKEGINLTSGNVPDFLKSLVDPNSAEFTAVKDLTNRDISRAVNENLVRRNISRGGVGLSTIAQAISDSSTKLNYQNFQQINSNKKNLYDTGLDVLSGVRSASLSKTGMNNSYTLGSRQLAIQEQKLADEEQAAKDNQWSQILSSVIGAASMVYGGGIGAAAGGAAATTTSKLGSAVVV